MRAFVLLVVAGLFATAAHAAGTKAGLWEMAMKSDEIRDMPQMPPAQIEQMRKMGIEMPTMRDGALVQRVCITPEMAARNQTPDVGREPGDCKVKNQTRSGNSYSTVIVCDGPNLKGDGTVKGTFTADNRFTSVYDFKGTARGRPVTQHHETSGKWLSADCGNVRPLGEMMGRPRK